MGKGHSRLNEKYKLSNEERIIYSDSVHYKDPELPPDKQEFPALPETAKIPSLTYQGLYALPSVPNTESGKVKKMSDPSKREIKSRIKSFDCANRDEALLESIYRLDIPCTLLLLKKGANPNYNGPFKKVNLDSRDIDSKDKANGTAFSTPLTILATKGIRGFNTIDDPSINRYALTGEQEVKAIVKIGSILLQYGADLTRQLAFHGSTAFHVASFCDNIVLIKLLAQSLYSHGSEQLSYEINRRNNWGETPLLIAARQGYTEICVTLLNYGASVRVPNRKISHIARSKGFLETAKILEEDEILQDFDE